MHYTYVQFLTQKACLDIGFHHIPVLLCMLLLVCCAVALLASVYDSSGNVRSEFYNMFYADSYYVLNAAIPYGFLYVLNITKFYAIIL